MSRTCAAPWAPVVSAIVTTLALAMAGCRPAGEAPATTADSSATVTPLATGKAAAALGGTEWRLIEIQSMDDAVGTRKPAPDAVYTMRLAQDGTVNMVLNCNRANGTWTATPSADGASGQFTFGPLAATRALCPPPSLDEEISGQAQYIRGYLLRDGNLYLTLMADGGIWAWEPIESIPFETTADPRLEAAIRAAEPAYTSRVVDAEGGVGRARYVYNRLDLNGDGRREVLVYLLGAMFCGTGGCNLLLFTEVDGGYRLVQRFIRSRLPVIVSEGKTSGWADLSYQQSGGGGPAEYVRFGFDGGKYVERERMPLDRQPAGGRYLAGELTFEQGIPLEPGK
jgi:heat shock protein HslJ